MVERQAEGDDVSQRDGALVLPGLAADGADGEDARLAGVEDGNASVDAEHPDVRDREGAPRQLGGRERAGAGGLDQLGDRIGEIHEAERVRVRSEEHTSELQSLMRISYAVFCLKK